MFYCSLFTYDQDCCNKFFSFPYKRDISFKNLFLNLVRFIIALNIVLFIKGLLLALTNFCFKGAVLFRASLHISKKESKQVLLEMFKFPLSSSINNQICKVFIIPVKYYFRFGFSKKRS